MSGITQVIFDIIMYFVLMINDLFNGLTQGTFNDFGINIYLFSDKGWFSRDLNVLELIVLVMIIFIFIFLLRLLWKGTKKFINMIFGVFRV